MSLMSDSCLTPSSLHHGGVRSKDLCENKVGVVHNSEHVPKKLRKKQKERERRKKNQLETDDVGSYHTHKVQNPHQSAIECVSGLFEMRDINLAVKQLEADGKPVDSSSLIDQIYDLHSHSWSGTTDEDRLDSQGEPQASDCNKLHSDCALDAYNSEDDEDSSSDEDDSDDDFILDHRRKLRKAKDRYEEMIQDITLKCRICEDNKANILLLPCGHLVCCDSCLMDVRRCPIARCNKIVRGTKEVFFA